MAKYDVECPSCGSSYQVSLFGNHKDREWKLENWDWTCDECKEKERQEANAQAAAANADAGLPPLTGSKKQIAWAETIRKQKITHIEDGIAHKGLSQQYDVKYNKIYDLMFMSGYGIYKKMRISNLIHEKSFKCLVDLPRYEPETYDRLCERIGGISSASRYAAEKLVFNNKTLPKHYGSWKDFRDFLLVNIPTQEHREKFIKRFSNQPPTEKIYQAQVGQLLINDYENSTPFDTKRDEKIRRMKEKWMALL